MGVVLVLYITSIKRDAQWQTGNCSVERDVFFRSKTNFVYVQGWNMSN
jgi:hypothetical protein